MSFCGSYRAEDVQFLLKPIPMPSAPIMADLAQKEQLIQTGTRHYSEMLSPETLPSAAYLHIFRAACEANLPQMAHDCLKLAAIIAAHHPATAPITLVSLMRAGTPVGVILKHLLTRVFGRTTLHFSVSIIRDRGIDQNALRHILNQGHAPESIVFVDGWTGKGVISQELTQAISQFNQQHHSHINSGLYVLADLAGSAAYAASCADYLIPSSILNATVSGLVSRSVLNDAIGPTDFHGCVEYPQFAAFDQSRHFADAVIDAALSQSFKGLPKAQAADRSQAAAISQQLIANIGAKYGIRDINLIKPGIGEATRVLLRRVPRLLLLRDQDDKQTATNTAHLKLLADEKSVRVEYDPTLPYQALALIRHTKDN
jgi:hypothetical protein